MNWRLIRATSTIEAPAREGRERHTSRPNALPVGSQNVSSVLYNRPNRLKRPVTALGTLESPSAGRFGKRSLQPAVRAPDSQTHMQQERLKLLQSKRGTSSTANDLFDSDALHLTGIGSSELVHPQRRAAGGKARIEKGKLLLGKVRKRYCRGGGEGESQLRSEEPGARNSSPNSGEPDRGEMKASSRSSLMRRSTRIRISCRELMVRHSDSDSKTHPRRNHRRA